MDNLLASFKKDLEEKGFVHILGHQYYALLLHFGATPDDLQKIEDGFIHKNVMKDREETMSFRQIAFHRVLLTETEEVDNPIELFIDGSEEEEEEEEDNPAGIIVNMGSFQPRSSSSARSGSFRSQVSLASIIEGNLIEEEEEEEKKEEDGPRKGGRRRRNTELSLAECESVTSLSDQEICSDAGAKVYFKRSGVRKWNLPPLAYIDSTVPEAIAKILDLLQPDKHDDQGETINTESKVTINDQLLIRINKKVGDEAEPTPEGIHQDATEISSVTLIRRENVVKDQGCESRIWKLDQPTGNYDSTSSGELDRDSNLPVLGGFSWDNCLFNKALESPWETILFNDRMVKHEARGFFPQDESKPSYRDVIVNFLRKPLSNGNDECMVNGKIESIV